MILEIISSIIWFYSNQTSKSWMIEIKEKTSCNFSNYINFKKLHTDLKQFVRWFTCLNYIPDFVYVTLWCDFFSVGSNHFVKLYWNLIIYNNL